MKRQLVTFGQYSGGAIAIGIITRSQGPRNSGGYLSEAEAMRVLYWRRSVVLFDECSQLLGKTYQ